jgi:arylsulfatase A-like enzyme
MSGLKHTILLATAVLLVLSGGCNRSGQEPSGRPNVILILTDDQGFGDLGCHGNPVLKTPNIDDLAGRSINFTNFHVAPFCTPTRASLLTGVYARRTGARATTGDKNRMRTGFLTLGDYFRGSGYSTALIGKWHLGEGARYDPSDRGFEEVLTLRGGGPGTVRAPWKGTKWDDELIHNGERKRYKGHLTDVLFDETMEYLENRPDGKPFFVYLPTFAPHIPWNVPEDWTVEYKNEEGVSIETAYCFAAITRLDYNIGRLMKFLDDKGFMENTIVIFMTDNGSSGGWRFYDGGHHGKKGSSLEHGHRVPCFFHWPEKGINEKRDVDALTAHVDWLPTMVELCSLEKPDREYTWDGLSMAGLILGDKDPVTWEERIHILETIKGNKEDFNRNRNVIMKGHWRLIDGKNLTHVLDDPYQENNLIEKHPELVTELKEAYNKYWDDVSKEDHVVQRIFLGEKSDCLTTIDLTSPSALCWEQQHVLTGMKTFGKWKVEFTNNGTYEFNFNRWPRELGAGLTEEVTVVADPVNKLYDLPVYMSSFGNERWQTSEGMVLPIAGVIFTINDREYFINAEDDSASFKIHLEKGDADLEAVFVDEHGEKITSVYYLYVSAASS